MHIERDIERLRPFENRPESFVVEEEPIGKSVDQGSLEAVPRDRALELIGRRLGIRRRNCGESSEALGMRANRLVEPIISSPRQRNGRFRVQFLEAGIGK